jgi:hypothetical protein
LSLALTVCTVYSQSIKNDEWDYETRFVSVSSLNIYKEASKESEVTGNFTLLQKVVAVIDHRLTNKFGWLLVVHPKRGYVEEKFLITKQTKQLRLSMDNMDDSTAWQSEVLYCPKEISFIKSEPLSYAKNIGLLRKGDAVLVVKDNHYKNKAWLKSVFPIEGFIYSNDLLTASNEFVIRIGAAYGLKEIPYEKNFSNYKSPYGGFIEFGKMDWKPVLRIGYQHSESSLSFFHLKSDIIYLLIRYDALSLFNNALKIYGLTGGSYWSSSFQNTKYPSLTSYFPLEKDSGFGYLIGGGVIYHLSNVFVDLQFFQLGTRKAIFGEAPKLGEFKNQYKIFPGSGLVNIMIGYRFIL